MPKVRRSLSDSPGPPTKTCFVTVGATASFNALLAEVLEDSFLSALSKQGFTDLRLQCGKDGITLWAQFAQEYSPDHPRRHGLEISAFDFNVKGLDGELMELKADDVLNRVDGLVVSHAGSGSILDAMRKNIPLIAVPNPNLLHNHQVELADQLATQGYIVHGKLGNLAAAIATAENLRPRMTQWPPINNGRDKFKTDLVNVMDDELGFLD